MHTYQYITKNTVPPTTYITATNDDSNQYPAYFTNPAKQAPWLPALVPDPSIPLKPGEKERGYIQLDVSPDILLDGEADIEVRGNVVLENWDCIFAEDNTAKYRLLDGGVLEGNIYVGKEGRLHQSSYFITGDVNLGVAEIMPDNGIAGSLAADGGACFSESELSGNIKIEGTVTMYISRIYGDVHIDYGNHATSHEEMYEDEGHVCFESLLFTLRKVFLPEYFDIDGDTYPEFAKNWGAFKPNEGFRLDDTRTFCLDTANHLEMCKCGIFLPMYLGAVPAAVQYFGLMDKRHPALLPHDHPCSGKSIRELEEMLLPLTQMCPDIWREEGEWFYEMYEDITGVPCPETYDEWLERMEDLTGVNPSTYLPA